MSGGMNAWEKAGKPCENPACREKLNDAIVEERRRLAKLVCARCNKNELVKDVLGRYTHRIKGDSRGDWLDDCYAAEIHDLLKTEAYQMKETDEGA